ncbi:MAG: family 43 glycosylhydrolase [Bacteroidales bacterium]|nr:family 43 glycosylhydrolase [Bacteroidales bacterium]
MKYQIVSLLMICLSALNMEAQPSKNAVAKAGKVVYSRPKTFCNPLDLPYRFQLDGNQREAADPVIVLYNGSYYLFASKSGGYWRSENMLDWTLVEPEGLPLEHYAPAVIVIKNKIYFHAGNSTYTTDDPAKGKWTKIATHPTGVDDPALFSDDDGRLYLYNGCSDKTPIWVKELDPATFLPISQNKEVIKPDIEKRGWEVAGDLNLGKKPGDTSVKNFVPYVEGAWMNKINGKYYLQYCAPGTQFKSYADGVFVSDSPTGPFTYASYSPFSYKPTGFVTGVGHSCTFSDKDGQYWHVTSANISARRMFERRLALFPTGVLPDGQLVTNTYLGDYPQFAPGTVKNPLQNNSPRWMLLSYQKPASVSSTLGDVNQQNFKSSNAFDEEIKTWWAAATGNKGEWLQVDLTKNCRIDALQINFADQGATALGRLRNDGYQYVVEASLDGKKWKTIIDRRDVARDEPHHYVQLDKAEIARYVRITNIHSPAGSVFSLYDFRIFGSGMGKLPSIVDQFTVKRDPTDPRHVHLSWPAKPNADFYIVRYGIAPDRLFSNYQVYRSNEVNINSLNAGVAYYFTVDAVNDSGITPGKKVIKID